jgi:putative ABC transport system permease protein
MLTAERDSTQVREASTRPGGGTQAPPPGTGAQLPPRRTRSGTLLLPPWTRAPLLALGEPAVILAVLAATAILACASSSAALFLSSASSESLHRTIAADCYNASYPGIQLGPLTSVGRDRTDILEPPFGVVEPAPNVPDLAALDSRARSALVGAGLAAPYHTALMQDTMRVGPPPTGNDPHTGRLFYRDGAVANIEPLTRGGPAHGIWVPRTLATKLDLRPGQRLPLAFGSTVTRGSLPEATVAVAGIYRDLFEQPTTPYWCSYTDIVQNATSENVPPALVIATDPETFAQVQQATGAAATHFWAAPISTDRLTLSGAREVAARQADAYRRFGVPPPKDLAAQNSGAGQMPVFVEQTTLVRNGLRGPVVPIALGGTILALLLVGAAGSYWADRRYREVRLLSSRGVSPAALAGKAVLELAIPAVAGTLAGWLLARWLVQQVGPSPVLDRSAPTQALLTASVALVAGLALLALVAGLRSRAATERPIGARRTWLAAVPWELLLLAAAAACYLRLRSGDAVVLVHKVAQINLLVVAFPLLFLVGAAVLVVRLLAVLLPAAGRLAGRRSAAWYLASRRIVASRVVSVTLLAAASLPIAMLTYAAGLTRTSAHTLDAKAKVVVGSTVSARTTATLHRTAATDRVGTVVTRFLYGKVASQEVSVLAIDPDTVTGTAYWDSRFADQPLTRLVDRIRQPAPDGRIAAIMVPGLGGRLPAQYDVRLGTSTVRIQTVATAHVFPGRRQPDPMIIVAAARVSQVDPYAGTLNELWSTGPLDAARAAIRAQGGLVFDTVEQQSVFEAGNLLGISWTFGYLTALAALVGLVAIGGLLLYLETRQRSRVAAYALGQRMGLTRATHLRSLLAELGTLLVTALVVGTALAWVAVLLVYHRLDVDPTRLPAPLLTVPTAALAGAVAAVAAVTVLAALYAQRAADRRDIAEVLRLGG